MSSSIVETLGSVIQRGRLPSRPGTHSIEFDVMRVVAGVRTVQLREGRPGSSADPCTRTKQLGFAITYGSLKGLFESGSSRSLRLLLIVGRPHSIPPK